jgi:chemotaxis signal transduction protein
MTYFIFSVSNNRYALNIENIQRIIQVNESTPIPGSSPIIDGMMSYEKNVLKILNFRKLIGLASYEQELQKLFISFKTLYQAWMDELDSTLNNDTLFTKTINPHKSEIGIWLDNFNTYDEKVMERLKNLTHAHKNLYALGENAIEYAQTDKEDVKTELKHELEKSFRKVIQSLDLFIDELESIANSLQKLILYQQDGMSFAIKVDRIEGMEHVEDSNVMMSGNEQSGKYLELGGTLELNGFLVNVIKSVNLPK